jgi:carbon-monoxide dehydrogenase small subunit
VCTSAYATISVAMESVTDDLVALRIVLNGEPRDLRVTADRVLIDVLRDDLGLTGTKEGCSVGVCGVCSVLVDGRLMTACLLPAVSLDGKSVTTIEGIGGPDGELSPVQQAFIRHGGLQCGICTPGQVVAATALLAEHPSPTEAEVVEWMTGNLCRCTGYYGIVQAILAAAEGQVGAGAEATPPPLEMRPAIEELVAEPAGGGHA